MQFIRLRLDLTIQIQQDKPVDLMARTWTLIGGPIAEAITMYLRVKGKLNVVAIHEKGEVAIGRVDKNGQYLTPF